MDRARNIKGFKCWRFSVMVAETKKMEYNFSHLKLFMVLR